MKIQRLLHVSPLCLVAALAGMVLPEESAQAQAVGGPLPPVPTPPDVVKLEPVEKLGKYMLYDDTMSNPPGYACATCHAPSAGLASGLESIVNLAAGEQPGVVPGRFRERSAHQLRLRHVQPGGPLL